MRRAARPAGSPREPAAPFFRGRAVTDSEREKLENLIEMWQAEAHGYALWPKVGDSVARACRRHADDLERLIGELKHGGAR